MRSDFESETCVSKNGRYSKCFVPCFLPCLIRSRDKLPSSLHFFARMFAFNVLQLYQAEVGKPHSPGNFSMGIPIPYA